MALGGTLAWLCVTGVVRAAVFQDMFASRQTVTGNNGQVNGDNLTATVEPNEPKHGGQTGGHSVWISWIAPADGVATFDTHGSSFDTLLSAYFFGSTNDTTVDKLHEAARNDDDPAAPPTSLIQFGALAGHHYEIAVDGYHGAVGSIRLRWDFVNATSPPPVIVSMSDDQAAKQGDPVTLTVNMQTSPDLQLRWRLNEDDVQPEANGTNLFIPSLQPTNVGRYTLRITIGSVRFFTDPIELQINSDGSTNTLARDKLFDSLASPLIGEGTGARPALRPGMVSAQGVGVVRGYNGSQIFNTTYATADPTEPPHCGVAGGASYWLMYQPPTNGTIILDTIGSTYDTVMEAYTFDPPLTGYQDLIPIGCDNDGVAPLGAARVQFAVLKNRQYLVAVDGVGGARGVAQLNYNLNAALPPQPAALIGTSVVRIVATSSTVTLTPPVTGAPPLRFSWSKDGVLMTNLSSAALLLPNVTPAQSGIYTVVVSNDLGGPITVTMPLRVVVPPKCNLARNTNVWQVSFLTVTGQHYIIEESTNLDSGWMSWPDFFLGDGALRVVDLPEAAIRFYRVRVE